MGSGNGSVNVSGLPPELLELIKIYQKDRRNPTLSAAFRELIETHPRIAEIAVRVYNQSNQDKQAGRLSP